MVDVHEDGVNAARLLVPGFLGGGWLTAALACGSLTAALPLGPWAADGSGRRRSRTADGPPGTIDHTSTPVVMPVM
jgi:hypothetical protein